MIMGGGNPQVKSKEMIAQDSTSAKSTAIKARAQDAKEVDPQ